MIKLEISDFKVLLANTLCFLAIQVEAFNAMLQTVLFGFTIAYTGIRIMNEYKKYVDSYKDDNKKSNNK